MTSLDRYPSKFMQTGHNIQYPNQDKKNDLINQIYDLNFEEDYYMFHFYQFNIIEDTSENQGYNENQHTAARRLRSCSRRRSRSFCEICC